MTEICILGLRTNFHQHDIRILLTDFTKELNIENPLIIAKETEGKQVEKN